MTQPETDIEVYVWLRDPAKVTDAFSALSWGRECYLIEDFSKDGPGEPHLRLRLTTGTTQAAEDYVQGLLGLHGIGVLDTLAEEIDYDVDEEADF